MLLDSLARYNNDVGVMVLFGAVSRAQHVACRCMQIIFVSVSLVYIIPYSEELFAPMPHSPTSQNGRDSLGSRALATLELAPCEAVAAVARFKAMLVVRCV
jgi:hypothetical protein